MNHIRTKRRSRLSPEMLEALMRIRLNGVNNLGEWPTYSYARLWIREGHMKADDPSKTGQGEKKPGGGRRGK